jgi:hypothetical protein
MIIELTIPERLHTMGLLPKEGNFLTLRVTRELISKIGFSADEITKYEIREENDLIKWNEDGNTPVQIEILDSELDIIKQALIRLNSEEKLTDNTFSIYEKIMLR